ncbi:hypothetical protein EWH70_10495 [Amycolatopsis suaedae]|uniref:YtkA-like domain-containing protein n=1 Tax=Amycolatopsis suaedae TaxID=2510978 RepID=A0A4Q7JD17_9PSEU|nr:hypothetical protein EWH70_10495 [Amycolatopsis suaedae]
MVAGPGGHLPPAGQPGRRRAGRHRGRTRRGDAVAGRRLDRPSRRRPAGPPQRPDAPGRGEPVRPHVACAPGAGRAWRVRRPVHPLRARPVRAGRRAGPPWRRHAAGPRLVRRGRHGGGARPGAGRAGSAHGRRAAGRADVDRRRGGSADHVHRPVRRPGRPAAVAGHGRSPHRRRPAAGIRPRRGGRRGAGVGARPRHGSADGGRGRRSAGRDGRRLRPRGPVHLHVPRARPVPAVVPGRAGLRRADRSRRARRRRGAGPVKVWLGVAGLVAVALLGWLLWPSAAAAPTVLQTSTKHFGVRLTVEDPKPGLNVIGIELTDPQGRPADARTVTVEPAMPRMGHALEPVPATAEAPGRYRATGTTLPMSGQWEITVAINGVERAVFGLLVND